MATNRVLVNSRYRARITKQCKSCGQTFHVQPSKEARYQWCKDCRSKLRQPPVTLICQLCQEPFTVKNHLATVQRFCSRTCRWNAFERKPTLRKCRPDKMRFERTCLECSKRFNPGRQRAVYCSGECVARSQRRADYICDQCGQSFHKERKNTNKSTLRFCGVVCRNIHIRGNRHPNWVSNREHLTNDRGPGWDDIAESIRQRDRYMCQRCGLKQTDQRRLDVHHIEPYRISHNNHPDNLITLCNHCHKIVESALPV